VIAAPDYCRPVIGWRVWTVTQAAVGARLASHVSPSVWEPGAELVASCDAHRRDPRRPWRLRQPVGHAAPEPRCTCGVHAMGRVGFLATYLPQANRPYSWMRPVGRQVIGLVSLWGRVIEGSRGWRASHAYPARLWLPGIDGNACRIADIDAIVRDLAGYGVPVHVCEGLDAHEVMAHLPQSPARWAAAPSSRPSPL
jgi:hypothetical protein